MQIKVVISVHFFVWYLNIFNLKNGNSILVALQPTIVTINFSNVF